jgi:hypothetical protein
MNKLKMLALTALAAATIGTGALASAPSASAMPNDGLCGTLERKGNVAFDLGILWRYVGDLDRASASFGLAAAYFEAANDCYLSQR